MILRPYQLTIAQAVARSILEKRGLTFSVEIARQGGKNELSAHLEVLLLTMFMVRGGASVKCSPTFKPQTIISILRLKERLDEFGYDELWTAELGYIVRLGNARQVFLSAEETSSVVGHTADILLEVDEAQDVSKDKYSRDFRPMASSSNCTTILYGTTWDDSTLLEQVKQANLEAEKKDGIRRHFAFDWQAVAAANPAYGAFVESERARLGDNHPLFRTQYALMPLRAGGGFLSRDQLAGMTGTFPRQLLPTSGRSYVAGLDIAGSSEEPEELTLTRPGRDATVLTIAEIDHAQAEPRIRLVEILSWENVRHAELYPRLVDLLKNVWKVQGATVDATGMGEPVCSFLRQAIGPRVHPFTFTQASKSELAFNLLAAVNSGRLAVFPPDGTPEAGALWRQLERARQCYRPNQTLNFYVDPAEGHDDALMSLALAVQTARTAKLPRVARQLSPSG